MRLTVLASTAEVRVRITDHGLGQGDLREAPRPDLDAKLAGEQTPRGWGLFLIRNMVDELHEHADDDTHTVELVLHRDARRQ